MKSKTTKFKGIISYPITPFTTANEIDITVLKDLIDRLVSRGSHAIAPLGSAGESAYLDDEEWEEVADVSIKQVAKRLPVVVGISDLTTHNAVRRAKFAERSGADAVMVLPMAYWKLSEQEIFHHYVQIAKAISIPIMVYNNPATSGVDMSPELMVKMFREIDNVTMVKESTGDIQRMHRLYQLAEGNLPFFNGSNPLALEAFAAGAMGWCTAAPNLIQDWPLRLYEAMCSGDIASARNVFYQQLPLLQFILKGGLPTTIKAGLQLCGFSAGLPRRPLEVLGPRSVDELGNIMAMLANN